MGKRCYPENNGEAILFELFVISIGGMLGNMCKVDQITENQARGLFARLCVEIDISKLLIDTVKVDNKCIKVDYESWGAVYFKCGRYGHNKEMCKKGVSADQKDSNMTDSEVEKAKKEKETYGPWLVVTYGRNRNGIEEGGNR
ncbi:hypothetical protein ACOSQ3_020715 [Xanthoceras sorbifolium]